MVLPDWQLRELCEGHELVTPYDSALINPASIDLRLSGQLREPHPTWRTAVTAYEVATYAPRFAQDFSHYPLWSEDVTEFDRYILLPGQFVLCSSLEYVRMPENTVGTLYSKSSTGRIGLEHLHAGYVDCGFHGTLTYEFHNVAPWPIELRAGKPTMQLKLEKMIASPQRSYKVTGRYNGQMEPTPAR